MYCLEINQFKMQVLVSKLKMGKNISFTKTSYWTHTKCVAHETIVGLK